MSLSDNLYLLKLVIFYSEDFYLKNKIAYSMLRRIWKKFYNNGKLNILSGYRGINVQTEGHVRLGYIKYWVFLQASAYHRG